MSASNLPGAADDFESDARFDTGLGCGNFCHASDAPDLGLRNHRFQSVAFHFKANALNEGRTDSSYEIVALANGA